MQAASVFLARLVHPVANAASTHSNATGQSSSGEVRRPQTFGRSTSLPPVIEVGGGVRESPQPPEKVFFLSY